MSRVALLSRRAIIAGLAAFAAPGYGLADIAPTRPPPRPAMPASRLIAQAALHAEITYAVLDPDGNLAEGRGADLPVAPASTLKALTALYALDRLGSDHRFATRIMRHGDTLILAGGGDPTFDTDRLAELAKRIASQPPPKRFMVWGGALPRIAEISPPQADHLAYNPSVSGMILNYNRVHFSWRNGGESLSLEARADAHSPRAYTIRARADQQRGLFSWDHDDRGEIWIVNRAAMRSAGSRWLPVRHPEAYAGDVFQTLCRAQGLVLPTPKVAARLPPDATEIARIDSAPLREILREMMVYSTNLTAEAVGLAASGADDLPRSARAMQDWAEVQGIDGFKLFDHSGMSPDSRVTARAMARTVARLGPARDLRDLMREIPFQTETGDPAKGDLSVQGKTGTLNFVSNLTGFAAGPKAMPVVFAIYCADMARRAQTEGQELPPGVVTWTNRAKFLQQRLVESWVQRYGHDQSVR